jgi:hypothetical protein
VATRSRSHKNGYRGSDSVLLANQARWLQRNRGLTIVYGLLPLGQGHRRERASLTHGAGDGLQSYIRPLVWSLAAPGQHGIRAPGANRCSGLEGTCLLTALPRRRSDRSAMCAMLSPRAALAGSLLLLIYAGPFTRFTSLPCVGLVLRRLRRAGVRDRRRSCARGARLPTRCARACWRARPRRGWCAPRPRVRAPTPAGA